MRPGSWAYLQLNVPLRPGDLWTNREVLTLHLDQGRHTAALAQLPDLWPEPKRPPLTFDRLPIDRKGRLGSYGPPFSNV